MVDECVVSGSSGVSDGDSRQLSGHFHQCKSPTLSYPPLPCVELIVLIIMCLPSVNMTTADVTGAQ